MEKIRRIYEDYLRDLTIIIEFAPFNWELALTIEPRFKCLDIGPFTFEILR